MNYYEHHIGDYAAATVHLSLVEDAVYSRMLRRYYLQESPLPADWREVARLVGARSEDELAAVKAVLAEFFTMADDGYRQKRADEVIAAFHAKQEGKAEERDNEAERKRRYRERRASLFDQLRDIGIVPPYDTPMDELVRMLSRGTGQGQDGDGTATQAPVPSNQTPEKQKHVQRAAARFHEFWAAYPVKKGKQEAEKVWKRRGLDAIADTLMAHVARMKAEDADWQDGYAPHGLTYVRGERWHDEPKQRNRAPPQQPPSKHRSLIEQFEGLKHGLANTGNPDRLPEVALLGSGEDAGD